jgi:hypothetical protein
MTLIFVVLLEGPAHSILCKHNAQSQNQVKSTNNNNKQQQQTLLEIENISVSGIFFGLFFPSANSDPDNFLEVQR